MLFLPFNLIAAIIMHWHKTRWCSHVTHSPEKDLLEKRYGSHPNSNHRIVRDPAPDPVGWVCSLFFILDTNINYTLIFSMNVASGPELVAAVTNAGGLGVIGGLGYSPKMLREQVSIWSRHHDVVVIHNFTLTDTSN